MLREEAQVPGDLVDEEAAAVRGAADVHGLRVGREQHLPARLYEAVVPVGLLAEEEEVLVEPADLLDRRPPDEHHRTHYELCLAHRVVLEATGVERIQRA